MSFGVNFTGKQFTGGNQYTIPLPGSFDLSDYEVSVGSLYVSYSWFNISAALNNNSYQIVIPLATPITLTIEIEDGAYQISTLNNALQYWFIENGLYLQNPITLDYFYFAAFVVNGPAYSVDLITTALPSSGTSTNLTASPSLNSYVGIAGSWTGASTDATVGSAFSDLWPTASNQSMQIIVSSTNNFGNIIGFAAGIFPAAPTISGTYLTTQSTFTPNVNPIYAVEARLSCCYSKFSTNSQFLIQFVNGDTLPGGMINASPTYYRARACNGYHNTLYFTLFDQDGNPLGFVDPNLACTLNFTKVRNLDSLT